MVAGQVSLAAAFVAGLFSFFTPCVVPLVPVYLGYIAGPLAGGEAGRGKRRLGHATVFVVGFGLVFVLLGAAAGWLGGLLYPAMPYVVRAGGLLLVILGLHMTGLLRLSVLQADSRRALDPARPRGLATSFMVGVVFAAGWTPCVGPVLAAILLLAADSRTASAGSVLLGAYSLGMGLPFLAAAAAVDAVLPRLRSAGRALHVLSVVGGALLVVMGVALLTGLFQALVFWLNALTYALWQ